jgi:hypothetical protein
MQGDFNLTLTEDGFLPAAFMVRAPLRLGHTYNGGLSSGKQNIPDDKGVSASLCLGGLFYVGRDSSGCSRLTGRVCIALGLLYIR